MTEQELQAIEARDRAKRALGGSPTSDVVALLAEVRRLQGLIKQAEWDGGDGHRYEVESCCPWCCAHQSRGHESDCPAFGGPAK
jgi:hypothetical protein